MSWLSIDSFSLLWAKLGLRDLEKMAPTFDVAYKRRMRNVVLRYIQLKGSQEIPPESEESSEKIPYKVNKFMVNLKTEYTMNLLSLVMDHDLQAFFNDLAYGLDFVISKWDKSTDNPTIFRCINKPVEALVTPRKPPIETLESFVPEWPPKTLAQMLKELEEFTGLHGTFVPQ